MITDVQYMQIVSEYYDLSDYKTKKNILFCNEAKKMANVEHIAAQLYKHIKANTVAIDFGTIPKSKGQITKIDNYQQLVDCLNTVRDLVVEYNEDPKLVNTMYTVIDNIQKREKAFSKAFALNIELPIMLYNMATMSVVAGTSLLVTSSVEFIKNGHDSFSVAFDKASYYKSQDHVLYQFAEQFNHECKNGNIDKLINECMKNNMTRVKENGNIVVQEISSFMLIPALVIFMISSMKMFFFLLRKTIYWLLHMKMKMSDWFYIQSEFLRINAENLKYREDEKGEDHRKVVYQRQIKYAETFKKISNALAIKDVKAQKEADHDDDEYYRNRRTDDGSSDDDDDDDGSIF